LLVHQPLYEKKWVVPKSHRKAPNVYGGSPPQKGRGAEGAKFEKLKQVSSEGKAFTVKEST